MVRTNMQNLDFNNIYEIKKDLFIVKYTYMINKFA